jgi:lipoate-protein ligase B
VSQEFEIKHLFPSTYEEALELQLELVDKRIRDEIPDTLLLTEHEPVFTVGRRSTPESLPTTDEIPLVPVTRGGDITYHGPGQIVGYWIRKLEGRDRDLHAHLRNIEDLVIRVAHHFEIDAGRLLGLTGVWVGEAKIASIGVAVRNWVTFHGFALNIDVDPSIYREFRPCGLDGSIMSDLTRNSAKSIEIDDVLPVVENAFRKHYECLK